LVDLSVDEKPAVKVLIHAVQYHPTSGDVLHVDFYRVTMTEKLQTDIELNFIGVSAAVKEQGGIFVRTMDKVKVECLPADLVHAIDVDISALKSFDDRIHVSNVVPPKGITIMENPAEVVASVSAPRSDSELESLTGAVEEDVNAVAGVEKKEEPAAEGEAAAEGEDDKKADKKQEKKAKE
jgi:large subunit ribosomal protein L25